MSDFFKCRTHREIFKMTFPQFRMLPIMEQVIQPRPNIVVILRFVMVVFKLFGNF